MRTKSDIATEMLEINRTGALNAEQKQRRLKMLEIEVQVDIRDQLAKLNEVEITNSHE